jgi:hypothetical protein
MTPGITDLRPEALPLPYHTLFAVQKEAYRLLAGRLARAVTEVPRPGAARPPAPGFNLDIDRKSRVAVVSGERGTGKTSAVLSLIHDVLTRKGPDFGKEEAGDKLARDALRKDVEALFGRVVWLDMLDMSPLPASANLFSAILVRLEEAAARLLPQALAEERPRSYLDAPDRYDSPLEKLRRLQTDVAVSWEGNLRERSGALEASAFAAEVRRVEHVRLKLNARLTEVLDGLTAEVGRRPGGEPDVLFVLPVDDFDLNPPRCLELLEMLRTLSVPRLFYVVLGDVDVAETMCGLQLAADVARVAGQAPQAEFLPFHRWDVQAIVANVGGNVIRKLLPPNQRVYLAALQVEQALQLRPPGKQPPDPSVADWLKRVPFDFPCLGAQVRRRFPQANPDHPVMLHDFLFAASSTPTGEPFYYARRFLQMPLRQLVDFWLTLEKTVKSPDPQADILEAFRRGLHHFCRDIFHAEESLPPEARLLFRAGFNLEPDTSWAMSLAPFQVVPVMGPARVEVPCRPGQPGTPPAGAGPPNPPPEPLTWTVRAQSTAGWEFRNTRASGEPQRPFLAPSTVGLLVFYTDLVTLARGDGEPNTLFTMTKTVYRLAATKYQFQGKRLPWLSWPFPPVLTFWEADKFLDAWAKVVRRLDSESRTGNVSPDLIPALVYHWTDAGVAVLRGQQPKPITDPFSVPAQEWKALRADVEALAVEASQAPRLRASVQRWVAAVLSLLNPDVLGGDDTARKEFRLSHTLKPLCQQQGKRFAEWKQGYLQKVNALAGIDQQFWARVGQFPTWWQ